MNVNMNVNADADAVSSRLAIYLITHHHPPPPLSRLGVSGGLECPRYATRIRRGGELHISRALVTAQVL